MAQLPPKLVHADFDIGMTFSAMNSTVAVAWPRGTSMMAGNHHPDVIMTLLRLETPRDAIEAKLIKFDSEGRMHCSDGPSVTWSTGDVQYHWHGVEVPEQVILRPQSISVDEIDREANLEVRRIMLERFGGWDRYLKECKGKRVAIDKVGVLYERKRKGEETIKFVKVRNSTPEPDGSIKDYFLRVPPDVKTPTAGIAWTFNLGEKDYRPELET